MRQDQFNVTVAVTDPDTGQHVNLGTWAKATGGDVDSTETKYRPGGGAEEITIGGAKSTSNVVVEKLCIVDVDGANIAKWMGWAGRAQCSVTFHFLTPNYSATGVSLTYQGQIKKVTPPQPDANAQGAGLITLELSVAGLPS